LFEGANILDAPRHAEDSEMNSRFAIAGWIPFLAFAGATVAHGDDFAEGAKLYEKECMVCHGSAVPTAAGNRDTAPMPQFAWAALESGDAGTVTDVPLHARPLHGERLAVSPPYGPHLRGVYGRIAGTVEGFQYSKEFKQAFAGMEWNEATLDVFITDTQRWVPGITMFYRQRDAEIRRKIIHYLKEVR
jgi:cytochrome c2